MSGGPQRVLVCSGHMIDAPGRKAARFPAAKEGMVRERIALQLDRWHVGAGDVAISGGARGADILFSEEALVRGARGMLLVALPEERYLEVSVRLPGSDWEHRYRMLREKCETRFQHELLGPVPEGMNVFARNNLWLIDTARAMAANNDIYALLVWDERPTGDGPGGTSDFAGRISKLGGHLAIINPDRL
jgi:hypothetical protein